MSMPGRDIPTDYLPDWVAPAPHMRVSTPELDFTDRLDKEMVALTDDTINSADLIVRVLEELGAVIEIQKTGANVRVDASPLRLVGLAGATGLAAALSLRHRALGAALIGASALAYKLTTPVRVRTHPNYTVLAKLGSASAKNTLIFLTTQSSGTVCLLETARQLHMLPLTDLRVVLIIGSNPELDFECEHTLVLGVDGLGGEHLALPRGMTPTQPFDANVLTVLDDLADDLHINIQHKVYLENSQPDPALPAGYPAARLGSLREASTADDGVDYETVAAGIQLCTALAYRLNATWLTAPA